MRISDWSSDVCSSDLTISGLESVGGFGGKAVALAQGELYSDDPGSYKKDLENLAAQTPANVKAVADKWLSRPTSALTIAPGDRAAYPEATPTAKIPDKKIGRESSRESGCQSV